MKGHEAAIKVRVGVITVSTSRWKQLGDANLEMLKQIDDPSGRSIVDELGDEVVEYKLVPDDEQRISHAIFDMLERVDAIITTGGTGINPRDVTIEVVEKLVEKKLNGFGEIFRRLSYNEIGEAAILSRTFAGVVEGKAIFCLPGSQKAVRLGLKLIKPSLRHVISHARGLK
jgi:molybdenum cofactor biosynthesis protein B